MSNERKARDLDKELFQVSNPEEATEVPDPEPHSQVVKERFDKASKLLCVSGGIIFLLGRTVKETGKLYETASSSEEGKKKEKNKKKKGRHHDTD